MDYQQKIRELIHSNYNEINVKFTSTGIPTNVVKIYYHDSKIFVNVNNLYDRFVSLVYAIAYYYTAKVAYSVKKNIDYQDVKDLTFDIFDSLNQNENDGINSDNIEKVINSRVKFEFFNV